LVDAAVKKINDMLEACVERSRISSSPVPVIAVGGGSILMPDRIGDLDVIRPENFAVANAVGAAIAQISGETDRVFS
ncbi:hydantoinase/oxoprolinase family protein, partial [Rhizobium sp. BR5]